VRVRTTIDLDSQTGEVLLTALKLTQEKQAVVLRQAVRLGLPLVINRLQAPLPEGALADCYPQAPERRRLKQAMAQVKTSPRRESAP
jgi:hypothetical protein